MLRSARRERPTLAVGHHEIRVRLRGEGSDSQDRLGGYRRGNLHLACDRGRRRGHDRPERLDRER